MWRARCPGPVLSLWQSCRSRLNEALSAGAVGSLRNAYERALLQVIWSPHSLEPCCPAEAGMLSLPCGTPASQASSNHNPARRVSISELLETLVTRGQARQTAEGRFVG